MTFTSIPPSLRPVVEDVARAICGPGGHWYTGEWTGLFGPNFEEQSVPLDVYNNAYRHQAEAAILAFLNACVERGVGWRIAEYMPLEPDMPFENPAFVLNLGATDDTA